MRDQVFISYSHHDQRWLERLQVHLKPFERAHRIQVWDDTKIGAGTKWRDEIEAALSSAKVGLLLVSPDFLASDFIANHELPTLLESARKEGLIILWVAVSASAYTETAINAYQAANDPANPLDNLTPATLNRQLVAICELVKAAIAPTATDGSGKDLDANAKAATAQNFSSETATAIDKPSQPLAAKPSKLVAKARLYAIVLAVTLVAVIGAIMGYSKLTPKPSPPKPPRPLTMTEFNEAPFVNLSRWHTPPSGWKIIDERLFIENQPEIGYVLEKNYADLEMSFNLRLESAKGAAWAIHVQPDSRDYYLFYLSGPEGRIPNTFVTYIVHDNKIPEVHEASVRPPEDPEANNSYQITIKVNQNRITTSMESAQDGREFPIGEWTDEHNTFTSGSIGFRTVAGEKFSVYGLFVRPPHIKLPE